MANLSITITNRIGVYGPAAPNRWGSYNWNSFTWLESDLGVGARKAVANSLAPNSTISQKNSKHFLSETVLTSDLFAKSLTRAAITDTFLLTSAVFSLQLRDGAGYLYNFPDRATDGEERDFTTWSEDSTTATTWSPPSPPSSNWS